VDMSALTVGSIQPYLEMTAAIFMGLSAPAKPATPVPWSKPACIAHQPPALSPVSSVRDTSTVLPSRPASGGSPVGSHCRRSATSCRMSCALDSGRKR
jgi:hypothetical protein